MSEFPSWRSYWDFAQRVTGQNRYFRDEFVERFCQTVMETSVPRRKELKAGVTLLRSQLGEYEGPTHKGDINNEDQPFPLLPKRMFPQKGRAMEGRANPKGIPYLYLASDEETAIAESRAGKGEPISLGWFRTNSDLKIVDCSVSSDRPWALFFEEPPSAERTAAVWQDIDKAFSHPVNRSDDTADYVPTQILAELFKYNGFEGVAFKSSLV